MFFADDDGEDCGDVVMEDEKGEEDKARKMDATWPSSVRVMVSPLIIVVSFVVVAAAEDSGKYA